MALALASLASLPGAQVQHKSTHVRFYEPSGRPMPAEFFIVRDAEGREINPLAGSGNSWAFHDVGRKLSFEYARRGIKYPSFEVVLEDAPTVYLSILADPRTGKVKYIKQKAQLPPVKKPGKIAIPGRGRANLVAPGNDACASAIPIFDGVTAFTTIDATTDGAPVPGAQYDGQTYEDVWYLYTPSCNGTLTASTCGTANYDTDLVLYDADTDDDGDFDALDAAAVTGGTEVALAANDDSGSCAPNGFTSVVATTVTANRVYLLRIGGGFPANEGSGTVSVSCGGSPSFDICPAPRTLTCGVPVDVTNIAATTAFDDPEFSCAFGGSVQGDGTLWFRFTATSTSAQVSTENSTGVSDTLLAVYDGNCGSLLELGCNDDSVGLLSAVCVKNLVVGDDYLVQVASYPGEDLGRITVELECPGPCDAACDDVLAACPIACGGSMTVDNTNATTDPLDPAFSCGFGGPLQGAGTVWFTFVAGSTSARVDTFASLAYDTLLAVYSGSPGSLTEIGCNDDDSGLLSAVCVDGLAIGQTYYIQAAAFSADDTGEITVAVQCPCGAALANDECTGAIDVGALPASVMVDITGATDDVAFPCGVFAGPYKNVWYSVSGTGSELMASTCNAGTVVGDTKISVFCADCGALVCVGGNDDQDDPNDPFLALCSFNDRSATVKWCSRAGANYLVTVGAFSAAEAPGVVQLDVLESGAGPCDSAVECGPTGACCLADGSCVNATGAECANLGGSFQGAGTSCHTDFVTDGSFEAGLGAGTWTEASTNFGTPLCDVLCGDNGGTGPRTGSVYAWFGGIDAFEAASLQQSVTIPLGASTLDFHLEIPVSSGNGVDFLRVKIDGTTLFEVFENDAVYAGIGYKRVSVPLGTFADGNSHTVRIESAITGSPRFTNFSVDDVSLLLETFECMQLIDFDTDDSGRTLGNGLAITTPPVFGTVVTITASGANAGPATFDSTMGGPNDPAIDYDMLIDHGNLLLLQDDAHSAQTVPGFFDVVTDDPQGGDLILDFSNPVTPRTVLLVDINPPPNEGATVTLFDQANRTRTYTIPPGWTGAYGDAGPWLLDLTTTVPQIGNAPGFKYARATETSGFQETRVVKMVVHMTGYGAIDELLFTK